MIERLVLVRHGETVHNVAGIAQGWNDSELSDEGRRQVARLAERLATSGADAVYSSPLRRALTTAETVAAAAGLEVQVLDDLREMSYGRWEGRSFLDVRREDEEIYQRWIRDPDCPCPGGESHQGLRRRWERALAAMTARRPIVVTHGTAIRVAATALLDVPVMASRHFAQDNASISVFLWRADRWVLKVWNDTTHCLEAKP